MGQLPFITQPFVIGQAWNLRILNDGQTFTDTDRITDSADCLGAAPEVSELPLLVRADGSEDDVVE